jgi:hypothetical protein
MHVAREDIDALSGGRTITFGWAPSSLNGTGLSEQALPSMLCIGALVAPAARRQLVGPGRSTSSKGTWSTHGLPRLSRGTTR